MIRFIVGLTTVALLAVVLVWVFSFSGAAKAAATRELKAEFSSVDGLAIGSEVTISGVPVGHVSAITLVPKSRRVEVSMAIIEDLEIPSDSIAQIAGDSLFAQKSVNILSGALLDSLADGEQFTYVTDSINIEVFLDYLLDLAEGDKEE